VSLARRLATLLCLGLFALTACQTPDMTPVVIQMNTPTVTVTPTKTPVWFPATDTPTPSASQTPRPTPDLRPGLGSQLFKDDFTQGGWQTFKNEAGQSAFGKGELTLAISLDKGALTSLRASPLPANVYLELTITPSLCQGEDLFGLYLRASSPQNGYRLLLSCSGKLRLERLNHGELVVLQDWTGQMGNVHGGILPTRVGVWTAGRELRVFLNDTYQFSVKDPLWSDGMLGAYARAASDSPLTVSFSDLTVYTLDTSRIPTATPTPSATPKGGIHTSTPAKK
jgi:hypothetical protein